ncbi:MAG: helix-turn-helix domain-containing protein [Bacteroidetes bacterium]|nr:MAG: helix-turn-helix domain-containing protein [Bacteroidota bacterium]
MQYEYTESHGAILRLRLEESTLARAFFEERGEKLLAIAWNRGPEQQVWIDEVPVIFPAGHAMTLVVSQSFRFERPAEVVLWQYNREFYCIVDHDQEVSCVGFLFYGSSASLMIRLEEADQTSLDLLLRVFREEFEERDSIQGEMLRVLLKRLIIKLTRLAKKQHTQPHTTQPALDIIRQFNLLVENNYRKLHQVQQYADLLNKSPKTLANLFALHQQDSPLQIINNRLAIEARRLLIYTEKSGSEIAWELGFEELSHFSRFFKKATGQSPSECRQEHKLLTSGSIDK